MFSRRVWQKRFIFLGGAVIVGVVATLFAQASESANILFHQFVDRWPLAPLVVTPLGMAAYFTGVTRTPITAFVIIMEMTDSRDMLLSPIATAFIASGVSQLICRKSLYRTLTENLINQQRTEN